MTAPRVPAAILVLAAVVLIGGTAGRTAAQALPDVGSSDGAIRLGPLSLSPNITIKGVGVDDNVLNDPEHPQRDVTITVSPDTRAILKTGPVRLTLYTVGDMVYYKRQRDLRGQNRRIDARVDILFERFRPFVFGSQESTRDRLNNELDLRAYRRDQSFGGGFGVQLASRLGVVLTATRYERRFRPGQAFHAADLREVLSVVNDSVNADLRFALTPLTTIVATAGVQEDRFPYEPGRSAHARSAGLRVEFSPDAVLNGRFQVGWNRFEPSNAVAYSGLTSTGAVGFTMFGFTRANVVADRGVEYSVNAAAPYYVRTGGTGTLNQRLFGPLDVQVSLEQQWMNYREALLNPASAAPGEARVRTVAYSTGWNLKDRSRVALNYDLTRRRSTVATVTPYSRHRIFGSWTYGF